MFIPFWMGCVTVFTFAAAADAIWDFGWGYSWNEVLLGVVMIAFGLAFGVAYYWMYRLMRFLTETFYGPDSDQPDRSAS